jgi:CRP-like cAMP-binding protein
MATAKPVFKTTSKRAATQHQMVDCKAGEFVFREGDLGTEMYIVHDGKVEILKKMQDEEHQLALLEKGDFFGEMSILEDLPRAASARAVTDVKLLLINGTTFDQMLRSNPEIAVRMMRKLSRRLRETDRLLRDALGMASSSIFNSAAVELPKVEAPPAPAKGAAKASASQQVRTAVEPVPVVAAPTDKASASELLVHEKSGMAFGLAAGAETMIGRRDPVTGIDPDVDLTPVDTQRSTSRRHSKIYRRGDKFFLCEEIGTMNGTFANGVRLETGVPTEIRFGDEVRCGLVNLRFRQA